ncbi:hypothetical protein COU59_03165 [Candidatus Pacearchaeota archaeon CG10_big_fil_rev_8_21_14_0_10_34_12]|nr:MAG: hypothetical protein COU59_03165 [Candidatus Pacearchaeota archaeon CG10_big_fil_rev_8_21_14_0_10_34_12]
MKERFGDLKNKFIHLAIILIFLLAISMVVHAEVSKTTKWQSGSQIYVSVDGFEGNLKNAIAADNLRGSFLSVNDASSLVVNPGHDFDEIWVSVNGNEMALSQALAGNGLCGTTSPTTTYSNQSLIVGHYATEIEVNVDGEVMSLQDAINQGNISDVGDCRSFVPGVMLAINSNTTNYNIYNQIDFQNDSVNNSNITLTISRGVVVGSTSTLSPALTTGNLPEGSIVSLIVENNAYIVGVGGKGGDAYWNSPTAGTAGGNAINTNIPLTITNNGIIGGGGGGGGAHTHTGYYGDQVGNAGSGGAGYNAGAAGVLGSTITERYPGHPGTLTQGGPSSRPGDGNYGYGGDLGMEGRIGGSTAPGPSSSSGAAGKAIVTNGNSITWITQGDVRGAVI